MTKLKKSLFLALLTIGVAMASCSDGDDESSKTIELTGGTQTTQTVFADETTLNNGIKFTATEAWTATITEVATTKAAAGRVDWVELSAYSGGAGEFTLTMTLQPNLTGQSRKAEIHIVCGDTTIVIVIEQKGTTQDGTLQKMICKVIYEYTDNEDEHKSSNEYKSYEFKYNSLGRIAECVRKNGPDASEANLKYTETIAFDYTIVNEVRIQNRRIYHDGTSSDGEIEKSTVMLNEQGFATRITFPADYVGFEYNADNRLSKIDNTNTKDDYDKFWITLGYTDGLLTKTVYHENYHEDEVWEYTVDELYPNRYANDKLNIDPNGFLLDIDDDYQMLYIMRLFGNGSKCYLEKIDYEMDSEGRPESIYTTPNETVHENFTYIKYTETVHPVVYAFDNNGYVTTMSWNEPFKKIRVDYDVIVGNTLKRPGYPEYGYEYTTTNERETEVETNKNIIKYSFIYNK